jgi:hypothetical protein
LASDLDWIGCSFALLFLGLRFDLFCHLVHLAHADRPLKRSKRFQIGEPFDYVRPLATIEPTAIKFGLLVNASISVSDQTRLQTELERPEYHNALVVVAWEHKIIETIVQNFLSANGGDRTTFPSWHGDELMGSL